MVCIYCDLENDAKSVEHIVSEAFGNKTYTMAKGTVCDECNQKFSKFEGPALSQSIFVMERARLGIATKKGKNAKGKVGEFGIEGHKGFEKNIITLFGLTNENFTVTDSKKGTGTIVIKSFDKTEVPTSKLLLKMAMSALYKSKRPIFNKHNFTDLKKFVLGKKTNEWPFITSNVEVTRFESIPTFGDKHHLKKIRCKLKYCSLDEETLLFKFEFGAVAMVINILNRNLDWMNKYKETDKVVCIYPSHFEGKLEARKRRSVNEDSKE